MRKAFSLFSICCALLAGCATSSYQIQSSPSEATVDAILPGGVRKTLGKTPFTAKDSDVNPAKSAITFEIVKDNFERQQVFVAEGSSGKDVTINVTLQPIAISADAQGAEKRMSAVAENVAQIQRDIQTKNYDQALVRANRMMVDNPRVATFYSLAGNVYYLQKRLDLALTNYKKAHDLDPQSAELTKVIEKLEGLRLPGGSK